MFGRRSCQRPSVEALVQYFGEGGASGLTVANGKDPAGTTIVGINRASDLTVAPRPRNGIDESNADPARTDEQSAEAVNLATASIQSIARLLSFLPTLGRMMPTAQPSSRQDDKTNRHWTSSSTRRLSRVARNHCLLPCSQCSQSSQEARRMR